MMDLVEDCCTRLKEAGVPPHLIAKWQSLKEELASYRSAVVAYSGGVDSSFLAYAASLVLKNKFVAVTVVSVVEPPGMVNDAASFAARHGFKHMTISSDVLRIPEMRMNPPNRCYHCKTNMLHLLWDYARNNGYEVVLEGQNADDRYDYRPGHRALEETGSRSPLAHCGLSKTEIRMLAKLFNLSIWDQASSPCLASRFPYGMELTESGINQVALAEDFLHQKGFKIVRVRHHQGLARIEIELEQIERLLGLRQELIDYFRQIGFQHVTLDLQGYRTGSMNEGLDL